MNKLIKLLALYIFTFLLLPVNAVASDFPSIDDNIHVYDELNIISEDTENMVNSINSKLLTDENSKGAEIMIATISDLEGVPAFDYSVDFFNHVTIGNKDEDNGVLILLANDEIESKIYVQVRIGYGLEGALPDGKVGAIIDSAMIEKLHEGNYDEALRQGFLEIAHEVDKEYNGVLSSTVIGNYNPIVRYEEADELNINPILANITGIISLALALLIGLALLTGNPMLIEILLFFFRILAIFSGASGSSFGSGNSRSGGSTGGGGAGRSL